MTALAEAYSGEHPRSELDLAKGRLLVLSAKYSWEVQGIILRGEEPKKDDESLLQYGQLVGIDLAEYLVTGQESGEGELSVGVRMKSGENEEKFPLQTCTYIEVGANGIELQPAFVRRVFRELDDESSLVIADHVVASNEEALVMTFERAKQFDVAGAVSERLKRLHENICRGTLPIPPTPTNPLS